VSANILIIMAIQYHFVNCLIIENIVQRKITLDIHRVIIYIRNKIE